MLEAQAPLCDDLNLASGALSRPTGCGGQAVASRPEKVAHALAVALDCWGILRREREANRWEPDVKPWQRPLAVARAAHLDRWRESLRDALATRDH